MHDDRSTGVAELKAVARDLLRSARGDGPRRDRRNDRSTSMNYRSEHDRGSQGQGPQGHRDRGRQPMDAARRDWDDERQDVAGHDRSDRGRRDGYATGPDPHESWGSGGGRRGHGEGEFMRHDERAGRGGHQARDMYRGSASTDADESGYWRQDQGRQPQFGYGRGGAGRDGYADGGYGDDMGDYPRGSGRGRGAEHAGGGMAVAGDTGHGRDHDHYEARAGRPGPRDGAEGGYGGPGAYGRGGYAGGDARGGDERGGGDRSKGGWLRESGRDFGGGARMRHGFGGGGGAYGPGLGGGYDAAGRDQGAQLRRERGDDRHGERGMSFRGRGPRNYARSDERIAEDLNERLSDEPSFDAGDIEVSVKAGVVMLSGTVEQRWMKHLAEDMAEACNGVKDVENRIRVAASSGRRAGTGAVSAGNLAAGSQTGTAPPSPDGLEGAGAHDSDADASEGALARASDGTGSGKADGPAGTATTGSGGTGTSAARGSSASGRGARSTP